MTSLLNIVHGAYRATLEEQDDTVVWITHALRGAGADSHLLLTDSAVSYGVASQRPMALRFGAWTQLNPPDLAGDLLRFVAQGGQVFAVAEDLQQRGIARDELVEGIELVPRDGVARLVSAYDRVWRW